MSSTLKSVLTVRPARAVARAARFTLAPELALVIKFCFEAADALNVSKPPFVLVTLPATEAFLFFGVIKVSGIKA